MLSVYASATNLTAVTLSDTVSQPSHKAIYINGDGVLVVSTDDLKTTVPLNVVTGQELGVKATHILATGTTAGVDPVLMDWI